MLRLNLPIHSFENALDHCIAGIASYMPLRSKLHEGKTALIEAGVQYSDAARRGELFRMLPFLGDPTDVVAESITKKEFVKAYDQYFVPEEKPARSVYDSILNAAQEMCPFCGGIGMPRNLDHFLPKAFFPLFSVLPLNLVPACRDCNMDGKAESYASVADDQPIQPYLDRAHFFDEQWVFAAYHPYPDGLSGSFSYFVAPPSHWSEVDKNRASNHFESFGLAKRYAVKAAEHAGVVLLQMRRMEAAGVGRAEIEHILLQPGIAAAPFANHWLRGMHQALIEIG